MNGLSNIDPTQATEHLKNILNVGRTHSETVYINSAVNGNMETPEGDINFGTESAFQKIDLKGTDEANVSIYGTDVTISSSPLHHGGRSCSKVIIDNIVDYGWEQRYYPGRLVSIHLSGKYLAYALRGSSSINGFVRVIKSNTNNHSLIRGFKGGAKDLAFAHSMFRVLLGCIDEIGELSVYEIIDKPNELVIETVVQVVKPANSSLSNYRRIMWCPYVPEDVDGLDNNAACSDDLTVTLLVVTHNEKAEIWNVDILTQEYGRGKIAVDKIKTGMQVISEHKEPITAVTFSPDGIAVATASLDGDVKFFQVNMQENTGCPKCLHQWTPHNGKPLSSLFFLDNHKNARPDVQFWKFAITGADNNQELKLWSCETWSCLQTIRILPNPADDILPCIKAELDLSAMYLFLSDITRKVLYIFHIHQDPTTGQAFISSLSEFSVTYPVLSLAIVDVTLCKVKPSLSGKNSGNEDDDDDDEDDKDDDADDESDSTDKKQLAYLVKLFWINTKSLQSCRIYYNPKASSPLQSFGSISSSQDSFVYRDGLSDLSSDVHDSLSVNLNDHDITSDKCVPPTGISAVLTPPSAALTSNSLSPIAHRASSFTECDILLTPEDFTTSSNSNLPSVSIGNSFKLSAVDESTKIGTSQENACKGDNITITSETSVLPRRKSSQHSSTSSPSREVAEILAPNILNCDQANESSTGITKKDSELLHDDALSKNITGESPDTVRTQDYGQNDWPQAPDPSKEYKLTTRSEGDLNMPHARDQRIPARHSLPDRSTSLEVIPVEATSILHKLDRSVEALSHKLASVTDILHRQHQDIQDIQNEIQELHQQQKYTQNTLQNMNSLDNTISDKVEHIVSKSAASEYARLENLLNKRESNEKQRSDQQSSTLSQSVAAGVHSRLEKTLKQEIHDTILPHVSHCFDGQLEHIRSEIEHRLNGVNDMLNESVGKNLKSKAFCDSLSQSLTVLLQSQIQGICRDVFQNNVVPAFDKSCQLLFSQLNEVFVRGTAEYSSQLGKHGQLTSANIDAAINRFEETIQKLSKDVEDIFSKIMKEQEHVGNMFKQQSALVDRIRLIVQDEMRRVLKENPISITSMRSLTATPVSHNEVNPQHLLQLVKQNQLNEAFQQALQAVDIQLVLFLCEYVPPDKVFGINPCPLAQHVLLSLINQLSGDLATKTEIKVRYIEDAITSLDSSNPVTREHGGAVLGSLHSRVSAFLHQNSNHQLTRSLKRILLAAQSLMK